MIRIFSREELGTLACCIKTSGCEVLTLESYGRAKQVCRAWRIQIQDNKFDCLKILTSSILKRFISALNQIDRTPSRKYTIGLFRSEYYEKQITQQDFEFQMVLLAAKKATEGHSLFYNFVDNLLLTEIDQLIKNACKVFKFYEKPQQVFPKANYVPAEANLLVCPSLRLKNANLIKLVKYFNDKAFINLRQFVNNQDILPVQDYQNPILNDKPSLWKTHARFFIKIIIAGSILSFLFSKLNVSKNEAEFKNDDSWDTYFGNYYLFLGSSIALTWWIMKTNIESFFLSKYDENASPYLNKLWKIGAAISGSAFFPIGLILSTIYYDELKFWNQVILWLGVFISTMREYR